MRPTIQPIACTTAMNKLKRKIPYGWDLNVYRGCGHGCKYCFAIYTHKYLNEEDRYFDTIFVKSNIVEILEQELRSKSWKREVVNLGGVTDSYQPAEETQKLMPDILKLFIKYKTPIIISTKSDLLLRDYDLIDELSRITYVNIAATITTMDEAVREKLEPGGVSSSRRFAMLKTFRSTNASIGLHAMPIIPYLTDSKKNMEALCAHAADAKVHYMLPGTLYLRGKTRSVFFEFIQQEFPHLHDPLKGLFKTGGAGAAYKENFHAMLNSIRDKYGLSGSYTKPMKEKLHKLSNGLATQTVLDF